MFFSGVRAALLAAFAASAYSLAAKSRLSVSPHTHTPRPTERKASLLQELLYGLLNWNGTRAHPLRAKRGNLRVEKVLQQGRLNDPDSLDRGGFRYHFLLPGHLQLPTYGWMIYQMRETASGTEKQ